MKIAVLLIGISESNGYKARHWNTCSDNIKKTFKGCDFHITTYKDDSKLESAYMSKSYNVVDKETTQRQIYIHALEQDIDADFIITTRFDAYWHKTLAEMNIDYDKFNILCKEKNTWNTQRFVNDNFFAFPVQYKQAFIDSIKHLESHPLQKNFMHHVYEPLSEQVPIHFIGEEEELSGVNSFYKLIRHMQFTFGIITRDNPQRLNEIIKSIEDNNIPEYEIIIVGRNGKNTKNIKNIPFNFPQKEMWITKKKNIVTENAKYDNIVYMHDYIKLDKSWYKNFMDFGNDWDICMNRIIDMEGKRYRDWCLWPDSIKHIFTSRSHVLLTYDIDWMQPFMYISGAYWVAKKHIMEEEPLDEKLGWGESEDVEWSIRVRDKYKYVMNHKSVVQLLKPKDRKFGWCNTKDTITMNKIKDEINSTQR